MTGAATLRIPFFKRAIVRRNVKDDPGSSPAILFIHGLDGSPAKTWARMIATCVSDKAFDHFSLDCYAYPSRWSPPIFGRIANLHELSRGLETEIRARHSHRSELIIVAHSLGGLVARQYIINVLKSKQRQIATKLMLIAVPHTGATLANVATNIYGYHPQVSQLCKNADLLQIQNEDWIHLRAEGAVDVRYVIGGADSVVTPDSASPFQPSERVHTLIGSNHRSIVEPNDKDDTRYIVLKQFALEGNLSNLTANSAQRVGTHRPADVLFDLYSKQDELFYLQRSSDERISVASTNGHIWITGNSGVGKTSAARRSIFSAGRQVAQIILAGYHGLTALGLFRAMCVELSESLGHDELPPASSTPAELLTFVKRMLRARTDGGSLTILVEEIPLGTKEDFDVFLGSILQMILVLEADARLHERIRLAFTSIHDPSRGAVGLEKLHEKLQFIDMSPWSLDDLTSLSRIIARELNPHLSSNEIGLIARAASGSPRYIKSIFRRWRNGTDGGRSVPELIESIAMEVRHA
ncbi:hypothetical protein [Bradyrhizobium sp. SYSU BS000235]|uniref:alpha/beta hydrolase n=1 Tax=Bradyrhizobium sp. SYSU BS000235 TaxID=3411332 RepID=UPI003C717370